MRAVITLAAALAATLPMGLAANVARGDSVPKGCRPAGSTTIAQNSQARVYKRGGDLDACFYAEPRRPFTLASAVAEEHWYPRPAIKLVGPVVAYAISGPIDPNEGNEITTIERTDLRDAGAPGYVNYQSVVVPGTVSGGVPKIGSVVYRHDGAAAWIACPGRSASEGAFRPTCDRPGFPDRVFTLRPKAKRGTVVASGSRVDPHSLRLHGSSISWLQRGHRRSAAL